MRKCKDCRYISDEIDFENDGYYTCPKCGGESESVQIEFECGEMDYDFNNLEEHK